MVFHNIRNVHAGVTCLDKHTGQEDVSSSNTQETINESKNGLAAIPVPYSLVHYRPGTRTLEDSLSLTT